MYVCMYYMYAYIYIYIYIYIIYSSHGDKLNITTQTRLTGDIS